MFIKIIGNRYIPANMATYQHKEMRYILKYLSIILNKILENLSLVKILI